VRYFWHSLRHAQQLHTVHCTLYTSTNEDIKPFFRAILILKRHELRWVFDSFPVCNRRRGQGIPLRTDHVVAINATSTMYHERSQSTWMIVDASFQDILSQRVAVRCAHEALRNLYRPSVNGSYPRSWASINQAGTYFRQAGILIPANLRHGQHLAGHSLLIYRCCVSPRMMARRTSERGSWEELVGTVGGTNERHWHFTCAKTTRAYSTARPLCSSSLPLDRSAFRCEGGRPSRLILAGHTIGQVLTGSTDGK
jgi:hypothetical protein